jgi:hypothetical protein
MKMGHAVTLQAGMSRVPFPTVSLAFFIDIILPGRTIALGSTQPLTETGNISWWDKAAGT